MSKLKHYNPDGRPCFITIVTHKREPLLVANADLLLKSIADIKRRVPFNTIAWVIMPDHLHMIIDIGDNNLSSVIQRIKMSFGALFRKRIGAHSGRVWQNGFWDHVIRDENDMNRHMDYIHFNPVKHGHAASAHKWRYSSIHKYQDYYPPVWGEKDISGSEGEYGE
jgi:putative transposase